jgi:hypothetical protein
VPAVSQSCSFMRLRCDEFALRSAIWTILDENSTPMVWEDRTRPSLHQLSLVHAVGESLIDLHSLLTKRCKRHDLNLHVSPGATWLLLRVLTFRHHSVPAVQSLPSSHTCSLAPVLTQYVSCPEATSRTYSSRRLTTASGRIRGRAVPPHIACNVAR